MSKTKKELKGITVVMSKSHYDHILANRLPEESVAEFIRKLIEKDMFRDPAYLNRAIELKKKELEELEALQG